MAAEKSELLADFPTVLVVPVQWGDQDAMGHVNNIIYLRWCESARIDYLAQVGLANRHVGSSVGAILASIKCDFRRQVTFPDTIEVGARIARLGRSSLTMEHRIVSRAQQAVAADADSTMVAFDYATGKSRPLPDELRQAIEAFEGRKFDTA